MGKQKETAPKIYKIKLSTFALQNIDEITGYIAFINCEPLNAIKIGDAIFATIDRIALNPFLFKECEEIPTKGKIYRRAICFSWIIVYKIKVDEIIVLAIIHKSRKPSKLKVLKKIK